MTPEPEVLLAQWDRDVIALVRDHAEFRRRLDAACFNRTPRGGSDQLNKRLPVNK